LLAPKVQHRKFSARNTARFSFALSWSKHLALGTQRSPDADGDVSVSLVQAVSIQAATIVSSKKDI
jgi:hypothetical protein